MRHYQVINNFPVFRTFIYILGKHEKVNTCFYPCTKNNYSILYDITRKIVTIKRVVTAFVNFNILWKWDRDVFHYKDSDQNETLKSIK